MTTRRPSSRSSPVSRNGESGSGAPVTTRAVSSSGRFSVDVDSRKVPMRGVPVGLAYRVTGPPTSHVLVRLNASPARL